MIPLSLAKIADLRLRGTNHFECKFEKEHYFGFYVGTNLHHRIIVCIEKLKSISRVSIPEYFCNKDIETFYLFRGAYETPSQMVAIAALSIDQVKLRFLEICQILDAFEQLNTIPFRIVLSAFSCSHAIPNLKFFDYSILLSDSSHIKPLVPAHQRSQALAATLAHLLTGKPDSTLESITQSRRAFPSYLSSLIADLMDGAPIAYSDIEKRLHAKNTNLLHLRGNVPLQKEYGESIISSIINSTHHNLLVSINHESPNIVNALCADIVEQISESIVIDASDAGAVCSVDHIPSTSATTLIVCNPGSLVSETLTLIHECNKKRLILLLQGPVNSLGINELLERRLTHFSHTSINVDLSTSGVKKLIREVGWFPNKQTQPLAVMLSQTALSMHLSRTYLEYANEIIKGQMTAADQSGIPSSDYKPDDFLTTLLETSLQRLSARSAELARFIIYVNAPVAINFITSVIDIDRNLIETLLHTRLFIKQQIGANSYITCTYPKLICNPGTLRNSKYFMSYMSWLVQRADQPEHESAAAIYVRLSTHLDPKTVALDPLIKACNIYTKANLFRSISEYVEQIAYLRNDQVLAITIIENLIKLRTPRYDWEAYIDSRPFTDNDKIYCLEKFIEFYSFTNRHDKAVDCGIKALLLLGVKVNKKVSRAAVMCKASRIVLSILAKGPEGYFGSKTRLDTVSSNAKIVRICGKTFSSAYLVAPELVAALSVIGARCCRGSSVSPHMPQVMMAFALYCGSYAYNYKNAEKIYLYAKDLIDRHNLTESQYPVSFYFLAFIKPYISSNRIDHELEDEFRKAMAIDVENAAYMSGSALGYGIYYGESVKLMKNRIEADQPIIEQFNNETPINIHKLFNLFFKACQSDNRMNLTFSLENSGSTAVYAEACLQMMLSFFRNEPFLETHYKKCLSVKFGIQGYLLLVIMEQFAALELFKNKRYFSILRYVIKYHIYRKHNRSTFQTKFLHMSAFLFGMFGLRSQMIDRLIRAADYARTNEQYLDVALIYDQASQLASSDSKRREYASYAADCYQRINYHARAHTLRQTIYVNQSDNHRVHQYLDFSRWLQRLPSHHLVASNIERYLSEALVATVEWYAPHENPPQEKAIQIRESIQTRSPQFSVVNGVQEVVASVFVQDDYQGSIVIAASGEIYPQEDITMYIDLLALAFSRKHYETRLHDAINKNNQLISNLPVFQHEIGTPLSVIMYLSKLYQTPDSPPLPREKLSTISDACLEILAVVDSVTQSDTSDDRKSKLDDTAFDLHQEILTIVDRTREACRHKHLDFVVTNTIPEDTWVRSDHMRMRAILNNLTSNAVKYTDQGSITILTEYHRSENNTLKFAFSVIDTGCGIPASEIDRVVERDYRSKALSHEKYSGKGIGLWQVARYVNMLGGKLTIESNEGVGSCFIVEFSLNETLPNSAEAISSNIFQLNVLVCDDNYTYGRRFATEVLENMGMTVTAVGSATEAIEAVTVRKFPVIFLDIEMPSMDGFEASRRIKEIDPDAVIVALSAHRNLQEDPRYLNSKFTSFVRKPLLPESINKILTQHYDSVQLVSPKFHTHPSTLFFNPLLDVQSLRECNFSDIQIRAMLVELANSLELFPSSARELLENGKYEELRHLLHSTQNPLVTFHSSVADELDSIEHSEDLSIALSDALLEKLNEIRVLAEAAISAIDSAAPVHAPGEIIDAFEKLIEDDDVSMRAFFEANEKVIVEELQIRAGAKLKDAMARLDGKKAMGIFNA